MAPSTILSLLLFLAALWSIIRLLRPKYGRKLPPGPSGLPIIGNLHMLGNLPHRALHSLSLKYGPIMSIRLGNVPTIVVSSPQSAELFLKTHDVAFANRPLLEAFETLSYGHKGMAFAAYGPYWRNVRKLCNTQLLHAAKLDSFAPIRTEEIEAVLESLKKAAKAREVVDLTATAARLVEDMMCRIIFGRSKDDEYDVKGLIHEGMSILGAFNLGDYLPLIGALDLQGFRRRLKGVKMGLDNVFEKIIDEHQKDTKKKDGSPTDFVDVLLSMINQPMIPNDPQEYLIERTNIKAIMADMIAGAFDTSATAVEWAFSELLNRPEIMARLQEELKNVVGMDRMVEEKDLDKLEYLDIVVKETLRLHPVAPLLVPHEAIDDVEVNGYHIPKKSRVIINFWTIGRDPEMWSENAEEFIPERFINSNIDYRGREFQFIPFGSGRRGCPGMHMGLTTVRLILAHLVHSFNWELPHGMVPGKVDMQEVFGLATPRANHLLVVPTSYRLQN